MRDVAGKAAFISGAAGGRWHRSWSGGNGMKVVVADASTAHPQRNTNVAPFQGR